MTAVAPRRLAAVALAAALACACVGPTPYQPAGDAGLGYAAERIAEDRWRVSFAGNSLTPRATVEDYLFYRAAELAREQGAARFAVVTRDTEAQTRYRSSGVGFAVGAGGYRYGRSGLFAGAAFPADADPVTSYAAYLEVRLLDPAAPADGPEVYEAAEVIASIAPRLRRPPA